MSDGGSKRRRGQASRYLNGGENALMRGPFQPGDEQNGGWSRAQLTRMDAKFCAALERAFHRGLERRTSASACERPGAGDRDRLLMAS
jgi:hypothetical protein